MFSVAGAIGYLLERSAGICHRLFTEEDVMTATPSFGAAEWKGHFNLEVEDVQVPDNLLLKLKQPCSQWSGKTVEQTHILCLIPPEMSIKKLLELTGGNEKVFADNSKVSSGEPYWILLTKKTLRETRGGILEGQKDVVNRSGYTSPLLVEVAIAILAAKALNKVPLYQGSLTRCQEVSDDGTPLAIGHSGSSSFTLVEDFTRASGMAGVLRFPPHK